MVETGEMNSVIKMAQNALANFLTENKYAELRVCVNQLDDVMRMPVLLGAWRYLTDEYIIQDTFRQFMKNYNEGVM